MLRAPGSTLFPYTTLFRSEDYLYVSLTNQSAFSPTDTMPLRPRVKLLMGIQGVASLVTVGIIVARAVNRSEEHTSELRHTVISYAVFCLKKKNTHPHTRPH